MSTESDRLCAARCRLMTLEPWYGSFAMSIHWQESTRLPTLGVRYLADGSAECLWNPEFVGKLSVEQMYGIVKHEIEHLVRLHPLRGRSLDHELYNVACDMCINGHKGQRIAYAGPPVVVPPDGCWMKDEWPEDQTAEEVYERLLKESQSPKKGKGKSGKGQKGQGQGQKGKGQKGKGQNQDEQEGEGGGSGEPDPDNPGFDSHGAWGDSAGEVSEDEVRQVMARLCQQAKERAQGHQPGHLDAAIEALGKPKVKWRELLRRFVGRNCGNKRKTYCRRDRRRDVFGLPGVSHHAASRLSVIMDTSGSTCGDRELFFTELEEVTQHTVVNVLQWDAAFQGFTPTYRRNDWKKFTMKGNGGTGHFHEAYEWLAKNRVLGDAVVFFTDGEMGDSDWPKPAVPTVSVITTDHETPAHLREAPNVKVRLKED